MKKKEVRWSPAVAEREIIKAARHLTRLQDKRKRIMRDLKAVDAEIKTAKRELRAVTQAATNTEQLPPLREFGEEQG